MAHIQQIIAQKKSKWFEVNITPLERIGRVFFGIVGVISGISLLLGTSGLPATILLTLLILAGLDLIVTGATGYCPLYKKLGHVPASLRKDTQHENCCK